MTSKFALSPSPFVPLIDFAAMERNQTSDIVRALFYIFKIFNN